MVRRRPVPWIHRWSRVLIAAIAVLGILITGYLTIISFSNNVAACPIKGCDQVLTSEYAKVFGLPLALYGLLAYTSMGIAAIAPLAIKADQQKKLHADVDNWSWLFLFMGSTAMFLFSAYLMYILSTEIKSFCIYCFASALSSTSLFLLTILGRAWEDVGQLFFTGVVVGVITLVGTLGVYSHVGKPPVAASSSHWTGPPITTVSGEAEIALAEHLSKIGAKEYGSFNCGHCYNQKLLFGAEAVEKLNYVECNPNAPKNQAELCVQAKIEGTPTWEINGKQYPGTQSLEQLADLSGYDGPRNFKNRL